MNQEDAITGPRVKVRHCNQCGRDFTTRARKYAHGACSACYLHPVEDGWTEYVEPAGGLW